MKSNIAVIGTSLLLASSLWLSAAEKSASQASQKEGNAKQCSPELERMKSLVGTWTGKTDMGEGPVQVNLQ